MLITKLTSHISSSAPVFKANNQKKNSSEFMSTPQKEDSFTLRQPRKDVIEPSIKRIVPPIISQLKWKEDPTDISIDKSTSKPNFDEISVENNNLLFLATEIMYGNLGLDETSHIIYENALSKTNEKELTSYAKDYLEQKEMLEQALEDVKALKTLREEHYPESDNLDGDELIIEHSRLNDECAKLIKFGDVISKYYDEKTDKLDQAGLKEFFNSFDDYDSMFKSFLDE